MKQVTNAFKTFMEESGATGASYMDMVMKQSQSSALDRKTQELCYISALSIKGMLEGLDFHVTSAKEQGASRDEVKSAVLVGLPLAGITLMAPLEKALQAYDAN